MVFQSITVFLIQGIAVLDFSNLLCSAFLNMQMKSLEILSYSIVMYLSSQYRDTCLSPLQNYCESAFIKACDILGDPRMEGANEL